MRIGLDARYLYDYFTGVGRYSFNLIHHLAQLDKENEYIIFKNRARPQPLTDQPNFKETMVNTRPVSPGTLSTFSYAVWREGVDILHSHFPVAPLIHSFHSVITVHDLQPILVKDFSGKRPLPIKLLYDVFYRFAYALTIRRARAIITDSMATAEDVMSYYKVGREKIRSIHLGIDDRFHPVDDPATLASFREKYALPSRFVLYVGNTRPHKNVPGLLRGFRAFADHCETAETAKLVVAGPKERFFSDILRLTEALGLTEKVVFLDLVPDEDLPVLYSAAEFFVLAGTKEGFGLPPLEAMSCGTPVIVSAAGSLAEVVGEAGLLVDPHDPQAIGQAIERLWCDPALRHELRTSGLAQVRRFSWRKMAEETLQVYQEVYTQNRMVFDGQSI